MGHVEDEERAAMQEAPGSAREEYLAQEYEDEIERRAADRHAEVMGALRKVFGKLLDIEKRIGAVERARAAAPAPAGPGHDDAGLDLKAVASDADLDGARGDPLIKYDPKKWEGQSFAGYKFSETTPEYLDAMAKYLASCAYMAAKDTDDKKRKSARYKALDAARARGWAARLRGGWAGAPAQTSGTGAQHANGAAAQSGGDEVML